MFTFCPFLMQFAQRVTYFHSNLARNLIKEHGARAVLLYFLTLMYI